MALPARIADGDPEVRDSSLEIRVDRDRFTGARRCALYQGKWRRPDVSYAHGAVSFQFSRKVDTTKASFRVDGGPARSWTEVYPQLVETGATLEGRSLANPTGGKVLLPLAMLKDVHSVTIRAPLQSRPRQFSIIGLGDALDSAGSLACDAETGFVQTR